MCGITLTCVPTLLVWSMCKIGDSSRVETKNTFEKTTAFRRPSHQTISVLHSWSCSYNKQQLKFFIRTSIVQFRIEISNAKVTMTLFIQFVLPIIFELCPSYYYNSFYCSLSLQNYVHSWCCDLIFSYPWQWSKPGLKPVMTPALSTMTKPWAPAAVVLRLPPL